MTSEIINIHLNLYVIRICPFVDILIFLGIVINVVKHDGAKKNVKMSSHFMVVLNGYFMLKNNCINCILVFSQYISIQFDHLRNRPQSILQYLYLKLAFQNVLHVAYQSYFHANKNYILWILYSCLKKQI